MIVDVLLFDFLGNYGILIHYRQFSEMPTLAVPLRDMVMEQVDADRLVLSGGVGDNGDNVDIHMFTRSTRGEAKMIFLVDIKAEVGY